MSGYDHLAGLVTFRPLERRLAGAGLRLSPFRASWTHTVSLLARELRAVGARRTVLEVDIRERDLRLDGLPRANAVAQSPTIVLSFEATAVPGSPRLRYEVGTYHHWQDNVRAVALGLEALRAVDRYGVTKRGEQYAGWKQLPAPAGAASPENGRKLIAKHGSARAARMATHPDRGGSPGDFRDVQAAIDEEQR